MLTVDMLRQNKALSGLSDEVLSAVAEMSKNDENTVLGNRIGTLHGQYDNDIYEVTGIAKNSGEKSYDYAKRVLNEYKSQIEKDKAVREELKASKKRIEELEGQNADDVLRKQLTDARTQVSQLQTQLKTKEGELDAKKAEFEKELTDTHVDYAFRAATGGLKFKSGITEPVQKTLLNAAKAEVLSKGTPEFIEENGSRKLVLRGADGNILNNPKNNLNPYTVEELVMETSLKDVLDDGRRQNGGGTGSGNGTSSGGTSVLDLGDVRSQVDADKAIEAYLLSNGLTRDSTEFAEQSLQLRKENNVANLPIR